MLIDKIKDVKSRYEYLAQELIKPDVISDNKLYKELSKEYVSLEPLVTAYNEYRATEQSMLDSVELKKMETDPEMLDLLDKDIFAIKNKLSDMEEEIKVMLLPKDENDEKNIIMEIRPGAGGEEASLFAGELLRMYCMYAEGKGWKVQINSLTETELGGVKEASFIVRGKSSYKYLKYEGGVHRVQRVPETESSGRVHTSTATVAVLPEQKDVDIDIQDKDLRIDTYRSTGAGGQSVNRTDSAVRITHLPTGMVVSCQNERSQIQNREIAMDMLKSKLYDFYKMQSDEEYANNRKSQVGTGDRSERIRTYNYPQNRLTDHRINYTVYDLQSFLNGNLDELIDNLMLAEQQAKIEKYKA